ncbi:type II toxin-antitoxin system RelE/ParE family toxin [Microbacterium paludicola]|uniref:type II toxin-antitoxin system RelE/ParE family toxin n=1 Tax=Microbacterium paludicola TaxID=300019 RepID=UPI0031CDB707
MAEIELHDEIEAWLDSLSQGDWERVAVIVDRLAVLGSAARMPLSRSLGEGLFELRFTLGRTARRITYRFTRDGRIILLTTFRKQRDNERHEVARARRAADECAVEYP